MSGRVAVLTGGASLIGLAIAERWVGDGGRVVVGDRTEAARADVEAVLGDAGRYLTGDVTDDDHLADLVATAVEEYGRLDVVVNGAAVFDDEGYASSRELWHHTLDVNLVAAARLTAAALPHLDRGAAVVYIASVSGRVAQPGRMLYNVSKAGLLMLARAGALELAPRGIRVNTVSPGWTWSRNIDRRYGGRGRADAFAAEFQPLGRMAEPDEVAGAVLFAVSDDAAFLTGTDVTVDGGYTAIGPEAIGQAAAAVPPLEQ